MESRIGKIDSVSDDSIKASVSQSVQNVREVTDYVPYGIDSRPVKGLKAVFLSLRERAYRILIGVRRKDSDQVAKSGETRVYSAYGSQVYLKEDGTIIISTQSGSIITMAADGKIELNGNAKSTMKWEDFVLVWNANVGHMDGHVHSNGHLGANTGIPTVATPAPAKDMSLAENIMVKTNA